MRLTRLASCLVAALGLASGATADVIFSDGFESNDVGARPPANWVLTHGAVGGGVVSDPVRSGTRSLQVVDGNSSALGFLTTAFTAQTEGELALTFFLRPASTDQQIEIAMQNSAGDDLFANILLTATGTVGYTSRSAWSVTSTVPYTAGAWNKVVAVADLTAKTWSLTVNDQTVASNIVAGNPGTGGDWTTNVGRIKVAGAAAATPTFYLDDVELAIVPEPAVMGLMAAAGLLLLGRQRR